MQYIYIFPKLFKILPDADDLLSLEPEELAAPLLISLDGGEYINPRNEISYGILKGSGIKEYLSKDPDKILFALMGVAMVRTRRICCPKTN